MTWMIYGAYGFTGTLIAEEAVRRGHRPLLVGRSAEKLAPLARRLGLEYDAVDLADPTGLAALIRQADLVLNAAGPFVHTAPPLVAACLAGGAHYVDVANEIPVYPILLEQAAAARRKNVALMTGAGFGVVATNCLVKFVADQVPEVREISCAALPYVAQHSPGALETVLDVLAGGALVRREGRLLASRLGSGAINVPFPDGVRTLVPVPIGDLEAAYQITQAPRVTAYSGDLPTSPLVRALLPLLQRLLAMSGVRRWLLARAAQGAGRVKASASPRPSYAWARAVGAGGDVAEAWMEMGEGYQFTAQAAVAAAERLLAQRLAGVLFPAQAFGAEFVLDIPGTRRYTVMPQTSVAVSKVL